ncbi:MAG: YIP1 family protein, partial [archaeon]
MDFFKKIFIYFLLIFILVTFINYESSKANNKTFIPYESYNYNFWGEPVGAPHAYVPVKFYSGRKLNAGNLDNPQDVFVDNKNNIYILDSGNNRIICLDSEFEVENIIEDFSINGETENFDHPQGIFVTPEREIYIADTGNERIIKLDENGKYIETIGPPDKTDPAIANVFGDDFEYNPLKLVVDKANRIYVIVQDIYEGLMQFDIEGNFMGFVGAPEVNPSPADLFWRQIATEEQRKRQKLFLPMEFSNLHLDSEGFIFSTVAYRQAGEAIMRLNPGGDDILKRGGFHTPEGDIKNPQNSSEASIKGPSLFVDIADKKNQNIYSALDKKRGRIFTYDYRGRLLYVFGGRGKKIGLFSDPVAIAYQNESIMVLDSETGYLTVFEPTEYGKLIMQAINYYNEGRYIEATDKWQRVLSYNVNFEQAYTGIGRSYLMDGKLEEAMEYFEHGNDRANYSEAFNYYRREVIEQNFTKVLYFLLLLIVLAFLFTRIKRLRKFKFFNKLANKFESAKNYGDNMSLIQNFYKIISSIKYALYTIFHPFDGFWRLKQQKRKKYLSGSIVIFLVMMTYIFMLQYTGFVFNQRDITKLNIYFEGASVLIPILLFCIINWATTTLMDGKGSFEDIFITTSYALIPIIIINVPVTVISNYLILAEGSFYHFFISLSVFWSIALLFLGTMTVHEYSLTKNWIITICILIGMGGTIFIALL